MDDLEICKRIAEIEDIAFMQAYPGSDEEFVGLISENDFFGTPPELIGEYNPLTDGDLCFHLMIKYEIEAYPLVKGVTSKHMAISRAFNGCDDFIEFRGYGETLNKAICLAIIELNKDK